MGRVSAEEVRRAIVWQHDGGKKPCEIATLLHRDKSTIIRMFVLKRERCQDRRPKAFTETHVESRDPRMLFHDATTRSVVLAPRGEVIL